MRFCINCGATVEPAATNCAACGFELPRAEPIEFELPRIEPVVPGPAPLGWEYSPFADLVLIIAQAIVGLVGIVALICVVVFGSIVLYYITSFDPPRTYLFKSVGILFSCLVWMIMLARVRHR